MNTTSTFVATTISRQEPSSDLDLRTMPPPRPTLDPFMKWPGGKRKARARIASLFPDSYGRYFEPFLGGGAVFFHVRPEQAWLSDVNPRLVATYRAVQNDVEAVIALLSTLVYDKEVYLGVRSRFNAWCITGASDIEVAAWFLYLNRSCFNGLYRENQKGEFNVAFGDYTNPRLCDAEALRAASHALQGATLACGGYQAVEDVAQAGDVVFLDPPYVPMSTTANFTQYSEGGFTGVDQQNLAALFFRLKGRGVHVVHTNSSAPAVYDLYAGATFEDMMMARNINRNSDGRGKVKELLIY